MSALREENSNPERMPARLFVPLAAVVGMLAGLSASSIPLLSHAYVALGFWAIVGLALGAYLRNRAPWHLTGPIYGLVLVLVFLIDSFHGASAQLPGFVILCALFGLVGALCGMILLAVGSAIARLATRGASS